MLDNFHKITPEIGWIRDEGQLEGMFGATPHTMVNILLPSFAFCTALKVCIIQTDGLELIADQNTRHVEALKSLHIIDRTPKPSRPSSPDSDCHSDGGLTAAQAKQVEDLMKAFRKKVGAGGKSSSRKRIKREDDEPESSQRVQKRRRVERVKGKAVVDLTGGDSEDEQKGEDRVDDEEQTSNLVMSDKRSNFVKLDDDDERENLFVLDNPEDLIDLEEI